MGDLCWAGHNFVANGLSLILRPALKWFWNETQADWNPDVFLLPAKVSILPLFQFIFSC